METQFLGPASRFLGCGKADFGQYPQILQVNEAFAAKSEIKANGRVSGQNSLKKLEKVWAVTVIVRTFLRYSSMSDIFGLAYLVGQIED
jgi:hypothetical protein